MLGIGILLFLTLANLAVVGKYAIKNKEESFPWLNLISSLFSMFALFHIMK